MRLSWKHASLLYLSTLFTSFTLTSAARPNHVRGIIRHRAWTNDTSTSFTNAVTSSTIAITSPYGTGWIGNASAPLTSSPVFTLASTDLARTTERTSSIAESSAIHPATSVPATSLLGTLPWTSEIAESSATTIPTDSSPASSPAGSQTSIKSASLESSVAVTGISSTADTGVWSSSPSTKLTSNAPATTTIRSIDTGTSLGGTSDVSTAAISNALTSSFSQSGQWSSSPPLSTAGTAVATSALQSSGDGSAVDSTSTLSTGLLAGTTASTVSFSRPPTFTAPASTTNTVVSILSGNSSLLPSGTSSTLTSPSSFALNSSLTGFRGSGTLASSTTFPASNSTSNTSFTGFWTASTAVSSRVSEASITAIASSHTGVWTSVIAGTSPTTPMNATAFGPSSTEGSLAATPTSSGSLKTSSTAIQSSLVSIQPISSCTSCLPSMTSTTTQPVQNQTITVEIVTATDGTHRTTAVTWVSTEIPAGQTLSDGSVAPTPEPAWACEGSLCDPGCRVPLICPGGGGGGGGGGGFSSPKVPSIGPGSSSGGPKPGGPKPGGPKPKPGKPNPTGNPTGNPTLGDPQPTETGSPTATPTNNDASTSGSSEATSSTSSTESSSTTASSSSSATATVCGSSCTDCVMKRRDTTYYNDVNNHTFSDTVAVDPEPAPGTDPTQWFLDSVKAADKVPHVYRSPSLLLKISTSSSLDQDWPQEAHGYAVTGLFGCTSIIVTSQRGVWLSHIWEGPTMLWAPDDKEYGGINDQGLKTPPFKELFANMEHGNLALKWWDDQPYQSHPLDGSSILDLKYDPKILIVTPQVRPYADRKLKYLKEVDAIQEWLNGHFHGVPVSRFGYYKTDEGTSADPDNKAGKVLVQFNPDTEPGNDCGKWSNYKVWVEGFFVGPFDTWLPTTPAGQKRAACSTNSTATLNSTSQTLTVASPTSTTNTTSTTTSLSSPSSTAEPCTAGCAACNPPADASTKGLLNTRNVIGARTDDVDAVSPSPVAGQFRPIWFLEAVNAAQRVPHLAEYPDKDPTQAPPGVTSGVEVLWGNDPKPLALVGLYGCTSIIVTSQAGAFVTHIWEGPTISTAFGGGLTSAGVPSAPFGALFDFLGKGGGGYELVAGYPYYSCDPLLGSTVIGEQYNPKITILTPRADGPPGSNTLESPKEVDFIKNWLASHISWAPAVIKPYTRLGSNMAQLKNRPWGKLIVSFDPKHQNLNRVTGKVCGTSRHYEVWVEAVTTPQTDDWTDKNQKRDACPTTLLTSTTSSNSSTAISMASSSFNSSSMFLTSFASSTLNTTWSPSTTTTSTNITSVCAGPSGSECGMSLSETITGLTIVSTSMVTTSSIISSAPPITSTSAARTLTSSSESSILTTSPSLSKTTPPHTIIPAPKPTLGPAKPQKYKLHIYQALGQEPGGPELYLMGNLTNFDDFPVALNETGLSWKEPLVLTINTKPPHILRITAYLKKITKRDVDIAPPVNPDPSPPSPITEDGALNITVDDGPGFDTTNNDVCHAGGWDTGHWWDQIISLLGLSPMQLPGRKIDCVLTI